jgi:hypothetical protein
MYVERLEITNFRCIANAAMDLNYPGRSEFPHRSRPDHLPNVNLFIGDNGAGKSSVFKAYVLSVIGDHMSFSGFKSEYLVRRSNNEYFMPKKGVTTEKSDLNVRLSFSENDGSDSLINGGYGLSPWKHIDIYRDIDFDNISPYDYPTSLPKYPFMFLGYGTNRRTQLPEGYSEKDRTIRESPASLKNTLA